MVHNNIKEERFSLKSSTNNRIQNELRPSLKDKIRTNIKENNKNQGKLILRCDRVYKCAENSSIQI